MPDLGGGHELEHRVDHAESGAQDGDEQRRLSQPHALGDRHRRLDLELLDRRVAHRLVDEHLGEPAQRVSECSVVAAFVAKNGEERSSERVVDNEHVHAEKDRALTTRAGTREPDPSAMRRTPMRNVHLAPRST